VGTGATSGLTIVVLVFVALVFIVIRRMRPQPVNPTRVAITGAVFIVLLLLALGSDFNPFIRDIPAIIGAPFALALGCVLGWVIVRTMTFWVDGQTGLLWMRGGILFAIIYVGALVLRVGTTYLAQAGAHNSTLQQLPWLRGLSADFVLLSIGMLAVRAGLIFNRYRQHVAQGGVPIAGPAR
jgi:membrane protein CcdC involved in cytochrome C biogenesis